MLFGSVLFLGCFMLARIGQSSSRSVTSVTGTQWLFNFIPAFVSHRMVLSSWEKHASAYQVREALVRRQWEPLHPSALRPDGRDQKPWSYASQGPSSSPPWTLTSLAPGHKAGARKVRIPEPRCLSWQYFPLYLSIPTFLTMHIWNQCKCPSWMEIVP